MSNIMPNQFAMQIAEFYEHNSIDKMKMSSGAKTAETYQRKKKKIVNQTAKRLRLLQSHTINLPAFIRTP